MGLDLTWSVVAYAALVVQGLVLLLALLAFRRPPPPGETLSLTVPGWGLVGVSSAFLGLALFAYIASVQG